MITGEIKSQVDQLWNAFWSGGVSNPLSVIEQITYLLFIRRLDELHTLDEKKAQVTGTSIANPLFPDGNYVESATDPTDPTQTITVPYADLRWSRLSDMHPDQAYKLMDNFVFPFLQSQARDGSSHARHMRDARFGIPTAQLLSRAMDMIDGLPMERRDTKGDIYEYMLGKIASAGQNGQFRTPRHIIDLMVALTAPTPKDRICDPASGTCGFLVAASEYVMATHPDMKFDEAAMAHFNTGMFSGFDFDNTMLRIGSMNMVLHGVDGANISYRDSLAEESEKDEDEYSLILANPPFAGSLDYESCAKDLQQVVKTKKTELLFLALFLRLMKIGGRAAVIVPDGVLFGSSKAHKTLRQILVEEHKLDAVIKMPSGVFKPYAGVSTAILMFTKTDSGGTDDVWFYDMEADGFSLDDKRTPNVDEDKLGVSPETALSAAEHAKNNLPDILARWSQRASSERDNARTSQSFTVPKAELAENGYDLSLNRYKEIVYEQVEYDPPAKIIADLRELEKEITEGLDALEGMLK